MNILVRYWTDCGRMGRLEGIFICTPQDLEKIEEYGTIHFGEVLGKHSDVKIRFVKEDFEILTSDQEFIERLVGYIGSTSISGYNPLSYMSQE